jgi:AAA15 family ATPase/GTPase
MPQAEKEAASEVYLQKAVLEGYRTIQRLEVEFLSGLNVIIGRNGTGKTNLIEYLYRALTVEGEQQILNAAITLAKASSPESPPIHILRKVQYATKQLDILKSSKLVYSAEIRMSIGKDNFRNVNDLVGFYSFLMENKYTYQIQFIRHGIPNRFYFFDEPLDYSGPLAESGLKMLANEPPLILRVIIGQLIFLPQEEGKEDVVRNRIKNISAILTWLKEPLAQLSVIEDIRLASNYNVYFDVALKSYLIKNLAVEFKVNNHWLPFSSLSDGTKRVFYVVAEVMAMEVFNSFVNALAGTPSIPGEDLSNHIILLEEPELGLHPHQLEDLMKFLREQAKHKQIIVSTHSPIVLDSVAADELDRIQIAELTPEGTQLRRLTPGQQDKARIYVQETGLLSDYWRFSDLEA